MNMMNDADIVGLRNAVAHAKEALVLLAAEMVDKAAAEAVKVKMKDGNVNHLPSPVAIAYYQVSSISAKARSNPNEFYKRLAMFVTAAEKAL